MFRLFLIWGLFLAASANAQTPCVPPPESWKTDGEGRAVVLYRGKNIEPMSQGPSNSCVGCAAAKALEIMHGVPFSAEWIYGASRDGKFLPFPGSQCGWAAELASNEGVLPATTYAALGFDLTNFSAKTANAWERGPPQSLYLISDLFRSEGYYHIHSWEELRGAISNGYPVIVGSSVGFGTRWGHIRNSEGELTSRWWSRWAHAMVFIGIDDAGSSKAALILNSWGPDWVSGPQRLGDEPDGSFWTNKRTVERMLSHGDAYVILPIRGLK